MNLPRSPRALVSIVLLILSLSLAAYAYLSVPGQADLSSVPTQFTVNGKTFPFTYVATDESDREAGLMNRKITDATTMLFVFPGYGIYPFWMYDVNSSLDIIWLNVTGSVGRVVYLLAGAPLCSVTAGCPTYTPTASANFVIEAKAGFVETNGVTLGTTIQLD